MKSRINGSASKKNKTGSNRKKHTKTTPSFIVFLLGLSVIPLVFVLYILKNSPVPESSIPDYVVNEQPEEDKVSAPVREGLREPVRETERRTASHEAEKTVKTVPVTVAAGKTVEKKGELYIIIDDAGYSLEELRMFLSLPFPVTFAVLPGLSNTAHSLDLIRKSGRPFIIHQPMEPEGNSDPGPMAIMTNMSNDRVREIVLKNIRSMPGALGMNNHMGSKATADDGIMRTVLEILKSEGLIFIDSMTTAASRGEAVSKEINLPFAKRNSMFLDNEKDRDAILEMLRAGLNVSAAEGYAVMVGHVWCSELAELLLEIYPSLIEDGYELKDVRDLLTRGIDQ